MTTTTTFFDLCDLHDRAFDGLINELSIVEFFQLRLISHEMRAKISKTKRYQLVFRRSVENDSEPVPVLTRRMFLNSLDSLNLRDLTAYDMYEGSLNTRLALNAAFYQDMDLMKYALRNDDGQILLNKQNGQVYSLINSVQTAILIGRPTKEMISWLITESQSTGCIIDFLIKKALEIRSILVHVNIPDHDSDVWKYAIEKIVEIKESSQQRRYEREVDGLYAISLLCVGFGDLETAKFAMEQISKFKGINYSHLHDHNYEGLIRLILNVLLKKKKRILDTNIIEILDWLKTAHLDMLSRIMVLTDNTISPLLKYDLLVCTVTFECGRHDVLNYLDETIGLKKLLLSHVCISQKSDILVNNIVKSLCSESSVAVPSVLERISEVMQDPPQDYARSSERMLLRCLEHLPLAAKNKNVECVDWLLKMLSKADEDDYIWINYFVETSLKETIDSCPELAKRISDAWKPVADSMLEARYQYENYSFAD